MILKILELFYCYNTKCLQVWFCLISIFLVSSYTHGHSDLNHLILLFKAYLFLQRGYGCCNICEGNRYRCSIHVVFPDNTVMILCCWMSNKTDPRYMCVVRVFTLQVHTFKCDIQAQTDRWWRSVPLQHKVHIVSMCLWLLTISDDRFYGLARRHEVISQNYSGIFLKCYFTCKESAVFHWKEARSCDKHIYVYSVCCLIWMYDRPDFMQVSNTHVQI